jgi:PAS domain S-box-containing protein
MFDAVPVGLWLADPDGRFYRNNQAARRIWGCPPMVGIDEYGVFKARRLPSREEVRGDDWALARTIREKVTISNELLEIDAFDGQKRIILNSTTPVLNDRGEMQAAVAINLDVTELQRTQAELERLRLAIEQSQDTIVVTDPNGTIQYVNPAFERTCGYARSEALGKQPSVLKSGRQDQAFYARLWHTISAGNTWRGRFVNRRKDGSLYTEEATISPVLDKSDRIINYVAVKRDITEQLRLQEERERLEEQVEHSQRLESIGRLAGGVAHDLNNLLSPILGYGELLMLDLRDNESCRESVAEIVRAGERARKLVAQLLAFGRRQLLRFQPVDVNKVLADFENLLRRAIREDVEIHLFPAARLPLVRADVGQLEQVVMNLAVNGQDAMPDGGCLTIETGLVELDEEYVATHEEVEPGWHVLLCVSDTGTGMDEDTQTRIFEPFFTTKEQDRGTGLGLATVYGIVKQHGGSIWVYSEPGEGTTFKVYLPVDEDASGEMAQFVETPLRTGGSETILLAEDDEQVRGLAHAVLRREGYTVLVANGGEHALRIAAEADGPVDLLLTDVIMPDMNGRVLHSRLAAECPALKVLYMSGYTDNVIAHHGVLDPDLSFIQKPFNIHALARKVREVLDG